MTQLQYLEDLIDLKIKAVSDLSRTKRKNYEILENKVKKRYKAPSLPAYLLYEYHFKYQDLRSLGSRLGVSQVRVLQIMRDLNIPTRTRAEAQSKRIELERLVREKYGISSAEYIDKRYNEDNRSLRTIAGEIKNEFGLKVSYQTIANIMEDEGVERRTSTEVGELNEGRTYEEIHGAKKAKKIKAKISGRNHSSYRKSKSKKIRKGRKRKPK